MAFHDLIRTLIIIQFPIICLSHGLQDVILSPNEFSGKYVKFNRLIDLTTTKVPWEEPLKESARIALSSPSVNKDMLIQAPYIGSANYDPSAFGDIVILAKGKLKKFANETYLFEEIHDVCEYQCQNNADKYLENVTALWMVERIRHRDAERQYRYDLKFTIVPIFSGRNALIKSNNLEERLRNILKKTFILRDTDYPKYFQQIVPKIARRADINRSMAGYVTPNHLMHHSYSYSNPPKTHNLNMGEFMKKPAFIVPKPPSLNNNYYVQNVNRYPIRFPDSRENFSSLKSQPYRVKLPIKNEEERQEAHIVNNVVDHRGAVDLSNKQQAQSFANYNSQQSHSNVNNSPLKPLPARSTGLFMSQPAILLPQMPISLFHVAPYTIPLHLQVSTPANQMLYAQQPDVTTFRYPNFLNSHQVIPQFQYLHNKSNPFKESERIIPQHGYSLPDPVYHSTSTTTDKPIYPTQYTPKLSNYVTASSIQINSYDNNDFQPIVSPFSSPKNKYESNKKVVFSSDEKIQSKTTKYQTRHATNNKERIKSTSTTTQATPSSSTTDFPRNYEQLDYANYDIVATRPSVTKKTTEKPILKWLPKRHRNKTLTNVITTPAPQKSSYHSSASIETSSQSSIHPTIKASTHSQIFRGRNRFYSNNNHGKRNSTTSTVTEKSTTPLSSNLNQNLSKQFKRKLSLTTTLLPITTQSPINAQTTTIFPTYSVTSFYETKEPITSQSYSTSVSLQVDGGDKVDTTASYELLPASVETINSNSSNIKIYRASAIAEDVDVNDDRLKIDEIASTILKHAKSTDNVKKSINKNN